MTWDSDGLVEGYKIYRSENPIDISNLPIPIVDNVSEKEYTDSSISENTRYYYRASSFIGDKEKLSDEILLGDPYWDKVIFMAPFTNDMLDKSVRNIATSNVNNCIIDTSDGAVGVGCLSTPETGFIEAEIDAKFGLMDFTIELFAKTSATTPGFFGVFGFEFLKFSDHGLWDITNFATNPYTGRAWVSSSGVGWNIFSLTDVGAVNDGNWHHWALVRSGISITIFRDGVSVASSTLAPGTNFLQKGPWSSFGTKAGNPAAGAETKIQYVRLTKGVARYTSNFTVPSYFMAFKIMNCTTLILVSLVII